MQFGIDRRRKMFFSSTALCIAAGYEADAHRILLAWATSPISAFLKLAPAGLSWRPAKRRGTANAQARSRRGEYLLRGSRQRPAADPYPRLLVDVGHVAGADCGTFAALQAGAVGHARPWPVRLSGKSG